MSNYSIDLSRISASHGHLSSTHPNPHGKRQEGGDHPARPATAPPAISHVQMIFAPLIQNSIANLVTQLLTSCFQHLTVYSLIRLFSLPENIDVFVFTSFLFLDLDYPIHSYTCSMYVQFRVHFSYVYYYDVEEWNFLENSTWAGIILQFNFSHNHLQTKQFKRSESVDLAIFFLNDADFAQEVLYVLPLISCQLYHFPIFRVLYNGSIAVILLNLENKF